MQEPPSTPADAAQTEDARSKRIEVWIAGLLGVVAVLTAFATYKAVLEDGDTLANFNEGIALNVQAAERDTAGLQEYSTDQATYLEYVKATQGDDTDLSSYFRETLFSPELEEGVKWVDEGPKDAISPFQEDSPYARPEWSEADKLRTKTDAKFKEAGIHDEDGDKYVLATVVLSIALFLLGIAGVNRQFRVQRGLTALGAVVSLIGLIQILAVAL
ncbi:MAG TPA: hypothetical protein VF517_14230 [Thermoleophilaceae bacterium]|jgi:hypothetical protein